VKFLVDAQLPPRLSRLFSEAGHDAVHTSELPDGNRLTDQRLAELADAEDRVVVSKDRDFRNDHLLVGSPKRLLLVSTGNITNNALLALVELHLEVVVESLRTAPFLELHRSVLVVHRTHE
jgi:predicted nuclease of predicted toxin-antitoxin system